MNTELIQIKISEIGEVITGNTPPTSDRKLYDGNYPLIMPTDIVEGRKYIGETEETVSEIGFQKYQKALLPKNTPCVVTIGSIGKKLCLTKEPSFTNQAINAVKVNREKFDPTFIFYLFKYNLPQVKNLSSGTASGRENVSKSSFSKIKVILPKSKTIQTKIASILSAYDELIENNNQWIKLLEEMAEEIYKEWFVRMRFPAVGDQSDWKETRFYDAEGKEVPHGTKGALPEGWEEDALVNLTDFIGRGISPKYHENGECSVINQRCIRDSKIDLKPARKQVKKIPEEKLVRSKDILVNSTGEGTLGRVSQLQENLRNWSVDSHVTIIRGNETINCDFLGTALMLKQRVFENLAFGSTGQTELGRESIRRIKIIVPNKELQEAFGEKIHSFRVQILLLLKKNQLLQETRDLLLPRLISGKLSVEHLSAPD